MNTDKNEFFRKVTLSICSDLDPAASLYASFLAMREKIPIDRMYIELYEPEVNCLRVIAKASESGGEDQDILIPMPEEAKQHTNEVKESIQADVHNTIQMYNQPDALSQYLLDVMNIPDSSILGMPLVVEDALFGAIILTAEGFDHYTHEHAELLFMLREPFYIAMSNAVKHRDILELKNLLDDDNRFLHKELNRQSNSEIIGSDFGLQKVMELVRQVAPIDSPVLLLGETGTGKDVIANAIHKLSPRNANPFIAVNCGGIPDNLVDSELFGHEKGAFTGALSQKRGRFERANRGTIFLDEIGELPLQAQVRLLRVLQDKVIERVGGSSPVNLDIRIIAATNRNLEEMVKTGEFREDLWFRLNVFPVQIPPLRKRSFDIPALVDYFIKQKAHDLKLNAIPKMAEGAVQPLMEYSWPGNVRELQNIVERSLIRNPKGPISFEQFYYPQTSKSGGKSDQTPETTNLDEVIVNHITRILSNTEGKIHGPGGAADLLGINASTLRNKMNKLGISYGKRRMS